MNSFITSGPGKAKMSLHIYWVLPKPSMISHMSWLRYRRDVLCRMRSLKISLTTEFVLRGALFSSWCFSIQTGTDILVRMVTVLYAFDSR